MQRTPLVLRRWLPTLALYGALSLVYWAASWSVATGRTTLLSWIIVWPVLVAALFAPRKGAGAPRSSLAR
jgi:hypothetical protein